MRRAKVLIVDDSVAVRRLVHALLAEYDEFEIVGVAPNGKIGVAKALMHRPDLMVMDVEMPEMSGLEALDELARRNVDTKVVMLSSLTREGAATSLEALARGAAHCVAKPRASSRVEATENLRGELVPLLRALFDAPRRPIRRQLSNPAPPMIERARASSKVIPMPKRDYRRPPSVSGVETFRRPVSAPSGRFNAVVIATSTGGPNALAEVIPRLPGDLGVPVLVVQHMPPVFTRLLAERLDTKSALHVEEATEGARIEPGKVLIAPGDYHMRVAAGGASVHLDQGPPENSCRPAADVLFRSAADVWGEHLLGVVMTGMGKDALLGAEALVRAGGEVITQDEATSVVWGMPRHVSQQGLSSGDYPVKEIARAIEERVHVALAHVRGAS